ncbi:hypothetical protein [Methylovirgula sp. 4M-Z18]|uniref:hypothetical protein n=1 Tax=Methylovirgula sp. 4M-Z18 TaxID=2293567 RepID=UPI001313DA45|nr:hypothetical protein [Methylovirgula sp. 4M-Z18]
MNHVFGGILATLIGIAFFFTIVGVFGLTTSVVALLLFVVLAVMIFRRAQTEDAAS